MQTNPRWVNLPAVRAAVAAGDHGALLRLARTAANLSLAAAGRRVGYSASTLSRLESGKQPFTDVRLLRRLAAAFDIPLGLFGLTDAPHGDTPPPTIAADRVPGSPMREGGEPVRRRELLGGLASLATGPLLPATSTPAHASGAANSPAPDLVAGLERVLLHGDTTPVAVDLRSGLAAARADFQASRYTALAARLPGLLAAAGDPAADPGTAAEIYNTAVHVAIKLKASGLDWLAADRAMVAARQADDPAVAASVARNVATLLRGAGRYDSAQRLALDAADQLPIHTQAATAEHLSLYGILLCGAGYAAAQAGDRSRSNELLDEAAAAGRRLGGDRNERWTAFGPSQVNLFRLSAAWRLGDSGTAIDHARAVRPQVLVPERQARYWVDVARAYHQWGRHPQAYRALLAAEAAAPEEIRAQPKVRGLAGELLTAPTNQSMSGLRAFATRVRAAD